MNTNIKLRKISKDIYNILNHYERYTKDFNSVSNNCISETSFLEKALNRCRNELSNVLSGFNIQSKEHQILNDVIEVFEAVSNDDKNIYYYCVTNEYGTMTYQTNRKGHILSILEWSIEQIGGNLDVEFI